MLGKVDTAALILELAADGASKQYLKNKMNLSAHELEDYLTMLGSKNLVRVLKAKGGEGSAVTIKITRRGIQFLNLYHSITAKYLTITAK